MSAIDTIYLERQVAEHPRALEVLARLPSARVVTCERYGEVFNPRSQSFRLQKANARELRDCKHGCWYTTIVGASVIALEHVGRCDLPFDKRHWRQRPAFCITCIASRINRCIRDTLQVFVDNNSFVTEQHVCLIEIKPIERRDSSGSMDDQVNAPLPRAAIAFRRHFESTVGFFNCEKV